MGEFQSGDQRTRFGIIPGFTAHGPTETDLMSLDDTRNRSTDIRRRLNQIKDSL